MSILRLLKKGVFISLNLILFANISLMQSAAAADEEPAFPAMSQPMISETKIIKRKFTQYTPMGATKSDYIWLNNQCLTMAIRDFISNDANYKLNIDEDTQATLANNLDAMFDAKDNNAFESAFDKFIDIFFDFFNTDNQEYNLGTLDSIQQALYSDLSFEDYKSTYPNINNKSFEGSFIAVKTFHKDSRKITDKEALQKFFETAYLLYVKQNLKMFQDNLLNLPENPSTDFDMFTPSSTQRHQISSSLLVAPKQTAPARTVAAQAAATVAATVEPAVIAPEQTRPATTRTVAGRVEPTGPALVTAPEPAPAVTAGELLVDEDQDEPASRAAGENVTDAEEPIYEVYNTGQPYVNVPTRSWDEDDEEDAVAEWSKEEEEGRPAYLDIKPHPDPLYENITNIYDTVNTMLLKDSIYDAVNPAEFYNSLPFYEFKLHLMRLLIENLETKTAEKVLNATEAFNIRVAINQNKLELAFTLYLRALNKFYKNNTALIDKDINALKGEVLEFISKMHTMDMPENIRGIFQQAQEEPKTLSDSQILFLNFVIQHTKKYIRPKTITSDTRMQTLMTQNTDLTEALVFELSELITKDAILLNYLNDPNMHKDIIAIVKEGETSQALKNLDNELLLNLLAIFNDIRSSVTEESTATTTADDSDSDLGDGGGASDDGDRTPRATAPTRIEPVVVVNPRKGRAEPAVETTTMEPAPGFKPGDYRSDESLAPYGLPDTTPTNTLTPSMQRVMPKTTETPGTMVARSEAVTQNPTLIVKKLEPTTPPASTDDENFLTPQQQQVVMMRRIAEVQTDASTTRPTAIESPVVVVNPSRAARRTTPSLVMPTSVTATGIDSIPQTTSINTAATFPPAPQRVLERGVLERDLTQMEPARSTTKTPKQLPNPLIVYSVEDDVLKKNLSDISSSASSTVSSSSSESSGSSSAASSTSSLDSQEEIPEEIEILEEEDDDDDDDRSLLQTLRKAQRDTKLKERNQELKKQDEIREHAAKLTKPIRKRADQVEKQQAEKHEALLQKILEKPKRPTNRHIIIDNDEPLINIPLLETENAVDAVDTLQEKALLDEFFNSTRDYQQSYEQQDEEPIGNPLVNNYQEDVTEVLDSAKKEYTRKDSSNWDAIRDAIRDAQNEDLSDPYYFLSKEPSSYNPPPLPQKSSKSAEKKLAEEEELLAELLTKAQESNTVSLQETIRTQRKKVDAAKAFLQTFKDTQEKTKSMKDQYEV